MAEGLAIVGSHLGRRLGGVLRGQVVAVRLRAVPPDRRLRIAHLVIGFLVEADGEGLGGTRCHLAKHSGDGGAVEAAAEEGAGGAGAGRSEEHTSELQSLMRISYAVF